MLFNLAIVCALLT